MCSHSERSTPLRHAQIRPKLKLGNESAILRDFVDCSGRAGAAVKKPYVEQSGVAFSVAVDTEHVLGQAFGLKAIPVSMLVDEIGIVWLRGDGPSKELLPQIEELLREAVTRLRGTAPQLPAAVG